MSTTSHTSDLTVTVEPNSHEMSFSRTFDAPRDAVFALFLDPDAIPNWWGPRKYTTVVDQLDARPGGTWRFLNVDSDDNTYAFHGVFHEVTPGARIVQTFEFEGAPGHVTLDTVTFEDVDGGKTLMIGSSIAQSVEARDAMVASGMEGGMVETYERLDDLLTSG